MSTLNLSGNWEYIEDYNDCGIQEKYYIGNSKKFHDGFNLPGSACENKIGQKQEFFSELNKESIRAPRERYEYIAPLWLRREFDIPKELADKYITLFLERVNIASDVWIDGVKIGRQVIELSAPHIYNLTGKLKSGVHTLVIRVDNRNLLNLDTMASGYSIDTQGYWNGIIGKIELHFEEIFHLENIEVFPNKNGIDIRLVQTSDVYSPTERKRANIDITVETPDGRLLPKRHFESVLFNSKQPVYLSCEIDNIQYWDEFNPALYTLHVVYEYNGICDEKSVRFGMRTIETRDKKILLNGSQISLRGTIDCAIHPLTGYPPTEYETWKKKFSIIKSYGLNHMRFHAWCPPENAFRAADELGVYISVEMPMWLNKDVCALELGDDPIHREYFMREALTISKTYGNHPSFIMFSCGNENMGDFELLDDIILAVKARDNRHIYTVTTNFDHPLLPCEDYLCAFEAGGHRVRMQTMQDIAAQSTFFDYSEAVHDVDVPIISFEVGQYCSYPNVDVMEKYNGNILPTNFDVVKKEMLRKGVYGRLKDYVEASGDLALKLYKEDIEAAMRTKDFGGFELLSLSDYTGQSTAVIGILDAFFDSKGITSPEEFRQFCSDTVPLFKANRIFHVGETIKSEIDLYNFGREPIDNPIFDVKIYNGDSLVYSDKNKGGDVDIKLPDVRKSCKLDVRIKVSEHENSWRIFMFEDVKNQDEFLKLKESTQIIASKEEFETIISRGGAGIVNIRKLKNTVQGSFIPVFWSPVHFPSQKPCGAMINSEHPVFNSFPTDKYPDYQWKTLLDNSVGVDISAFGDGFKPIVEAVPNFVDNTPVSPLFEARIGKARLIFCGFDTENRDLPSAQLYYSILKYVNSSDFEPVCVLDTDEIEW